MDFIKKNDYSYRFRNPNGVANVVTMQGVALSLSLGIALVKSDVSRRAWSGLGVNRDPFSQTPIKGWVAEMTHGIVLPMQADNHMARIINGNLTISQEILFYYASQPGEDLWSRCHIHYKTLLNS